MTIFYKLVPEWKALVRSSDGGWVRREDFESLTAERDRYKKAIERMVQFSTDAEVILIGDDAIDFSLKEGA